MFFSNGSSYTDTNGVNFSGQTYTKTSLVTVISEEANIGYNYTANDSIFNFYEGGVKLSPFAMGQYEVTQELYEAVMGNNPSGFTAETITVGENQDYRPVDSVNWYQAIAFCNELTKKTFGESNCVYYSDSSYTTVYTVDNANASDVPYFDQSKKGYRLPTEAEWECAARGGNPNDDSWENNFNLLNSITVDYAWIESNSNNMTHQVGKKTSINNLYDIAGNVYEWCWDIPIQGSITDMTENPIGNISGSYRTLRGGYWEGDSECMYRYSARPDTTTTNILNTLGFRLCRYL